MVFKLTISVILIMLAILPLRECARRIDVKERARETISKRSILQTKRAIEEEDMSPRELLDLSEKETMVVVRSVKTSQGLRVERLQERYDGVEVFDSSVVVEIDKEGQLTGDASGTLIQGIEEDLQSVTPKISVKHALKIATNSEGDRSFEIIGEPTSSLQIYLDKNGRARLVYYLRYFIIKKDVVKQPAFFIDAMNGEVLKQWNNLNSKNCENGITAVGGNEMVGKTHYGEAPFCLDMLMKGDTCYLENKYVRVIDMNSTRDLSFNETASFNCTEGYNDSINGAYSPAIDAFFHGTVAGKLFEDWFQTTPIPEKVEIRVHYGQNIPTAFWKDVCIVGDGGADFYPLVSLDLICHEIGHGITEHASGLMYGDQPGGINEAFSDLLGEVCEEYLQETDFLVGQGYKRNKERNYLRSFKNPPIDGFSIKHVDEFQPGMNVHHSSGIFNRVVYVLVKQKGLGIKQVFKVFYHANLVYWHHLSSFEDAACGILRAAYDLGQKPTEYVRAFEDVGIRKCNLTKHIRSLVRNRTYDEITVSVDSEPMFAFEFPFDSRFVASVNVVIKAESSNGDVGIKYIMGSRNTTEFNFDDSISTKMNIVEIKTTENNNTVVFFTLTSPNGQFMDDVSVVASFFITFF